MAKEDNLLPLGRGNLTPEEEREIRRKGQKAQQEKMRQRKTMREALDYLLTKEIQNKTTGELAPGVEAAASALFAKALKGDVSAFRLLTEIVGELKTQGTIDNLPPTIIVGDKATAEKLADIMEGN